MVSRLLLVVLLVWQCTAIAEIYRTEDATGVHYSDQPTVGAKTVEVVDKVQRYRHQIKKVYDGDTIILANGERVRLLGVNTPEISSRYRKGEPGGKAAQAWMKAQLSGGEVYLEYDQEKRDKYDRLLAHVFLPTGEHINLGLVAAGHAVMSIIPPNVRYADDFLAVQQQAEKQGLGMWSISIYKRREAKRVANHKFRGWRRYSAEANSITSSKRFYRLIISKKFDVRIPKENISHFPDLAIYLNKPLEIRGWVSRQKGRSSMLIRHPSAIVVNPAQ